MTPYLVKIGSTWARDFDLTRAVIQEATDQGTNDAQDDVANYAKALVASDEQTGDPTGNGAQNDPSNDCYKHLFPPFLGS